MRLEILQNVAQLSTINYYLLQNFGSVEFENLLSRKDFFAGFPNRCALWQTSEKGGCNHISIVFPNIPLMLI